MANIHFRQSCNHQITCSFIFFSRISSFHSISVTLLSPGPVSMFTLSFSSSLFEAPVNGPEWCTTLYSKLTSCFPALSNQISTLDNNLSDKLDEVKK